MSLINILDTPRGRFAYRDSATSNATAPADRLPGHDWPTVLLLHGWPESSACWERVVARLPAEFRYVRPDLRGMGDSERSEEPVRRRGSAYEKVNLAQDILTLLDTLGVSEFTLVGHDWGGIVAQEMAFAQPERINKLALLNISILPNTKGNALAQQQLRGNAGRALWYQTFMQMPHLLEAMLPGNEEVWLRTFLRTADSARPFPDDTFQEILRTFQLPGTARSTANYYRTMNADMTRWATLAGKPFAMPGLYIHGTLDPVIIPAYLEGAEDCFPSLDIVRIDTAAHFVMDEAPDAVADALSRFLSI